MTFYIPLTGVIVSQFDDVVHFVPLFGRIKAGDDQPEHALSDQNGVANLEFRFVGRRMIV